MAQRLAQAGEPGQGTIDALVDVDDRGVVVGGEPGPADVAAQARAVQRREPIAHHRHQSPERGQLVFVGPAVLAVEAQLPVLEPGHQGPLGRHVVQRQFLHHRDAEVGRGAMVAMAPTFDDAFEDLIGGPGKPSLVALGAAFEGPGRVPAADQPAVPGDDLDRLESQHADTLRGPSLDRCLIALGFDAEGRGEADRLTVGATVREFVGRQQVVEHLLGQAGAVLAERREDRGGLIRTAGELEPGEAALGADIVEAAGARPAVRVPDADPAQPAWRGLGGRTRIHGIPDRHPMDATLEMATPLPASTPCRSRSGTSRRRRASARRPRRSGPCGSSRRRR